MRISELFCFRFHITILIFKSFFQDNQLLWASRTARCMFTKWLYQGMCQYRYMQTSHSLAKCEFKTSYYKLPFLRCFSLENRNWKDKPDSIQNIHGKFENVARSFQNLHERENWCFASGKAERRLVWHRIPVEQWYHECADASVYQEGRNSKIEWLCVSYFALDYCVWWIYFLFCRISKAYFLCSQKFSRRKTKIKTTSSRWKCLTGSSLCWGARTNNLLLILLNVLSVNNLHFL